MGGGVGRDTQTGADRDRKREVGERVTERRAESVRDGKGGGGERLK